MSNVTGEKERENGRERRGDKTPCLHLESCTVRVLPLVARETKAARAREREESQKRKLKYARGLIDVVAPD